MFDMKLFLPKQIDLAVAGQFTLKVELFVAEKIKNKCTRQ